MYRPPTETPATGATKLTDPRGYPYLEKRPGVGIKNSHVHKAHDMDAGKEESSLDVDHAATDFPS